VEQEPAMSNGDLLEEIKASARELTERALTQRQLTEQQIRQVLAAISQGANLGVSERKAGEVVKQEMLTLADHARHISTGKAHRVKLVAEAMGNRLLAAAEDASKSGRHAVRQLGAHVALFASHKLAEIAARIEIKAQALKHSK
jgi:hypothetical protein